MSESLSIGVKTEPSSPILRMCESKFVSDLDLSDSQATIKIELTAACPNSFDDLFSDGFEFHNIIETIPTTPSQSLEIHPLNIFVENQIDSIEPHDIFSEVFQLTSTQPLDSHTLSSDSSLSVPISQDECPKKRMRKSNNPLQNFYDIPNSNMKKGKKGPKKASRSYPKKEYFRTKLIRSWKRFIRNTLNDKFKTNCFSLALKTALDYVFTNKEKLLIYALTQNGPLTEGQGKRSKDQKAKQAKTFNNSYVKTLFNDATVKESFILYVESEFRDKDCEDLIARFVFSCCTLAIHDKHCEDLWDDLREYSLGEMIYRSVD